MNAFRLGASRLAPITARAVGGSLERQVGASKLVICGRIVEERIIYMVQR